MSQKFVLLAQLDRRIERLAKWRAAAAYGLAVAALLLLLAGTGRAAQPLLPWLAGLVIGGLAAPLLLVAHFAFRFKRQTHLQLVRHLFRRGYRVDYPEFDTGGHLPVTVRVESHVPAAR